MSSLKTLSIGLGIFLIGSASAYFTNTFDIQSQYPIYTTDSTDNTSDEQNNTKISEKIEDKNTQFLLYFDFGCPHCREFYTTTYLPLKSEYSEKNVDFSILPYSQKTVGKSFTLAKYLLCIQNINPKKTDAFITNINIADDIKDMTIFSEKIKTLELSEKETTDFFTCTTDSDKSIENKVLEIRTDARENGVIGTPTFFINEKKFERNQSYIKVATALEKTL